MIEGLVKRGIYKIACRNLSLGVYDGDMGFTGIREKFGSTFLFTEYAWEIGAPYGTVRPSRELVAMMLPGVPLEVNLGTVCGSCRTRAWYQGKKPPYWACENGCATVLPVAVPNRVLYEVLLAASSIEDREAWERAKGAWKRRQGR